MKIAAVILTLNEEVHIERCILSLQGIVDDIYVIDSGSVDKTIQVARSLGVRVLSNDWINHASQFRWGIEQVDSSFDWIIRLDADEYFNSSIVPGIRKQLSSISSSVDGVVVRRRIIFQGKEILFGGVGKVRVLRIFRRGSAHVTDRWMDEHIYVNGSIVEIKALIFDDNLQTLSWWINKHNNYASYEALEVLRLKYSLLREDPKKIHAPANVILKRFLKESIYLFLPKGFRALTYFLYRYIFLLGFLDGYTGFVFHFNQAFWYRALVDAKVAEVERVSKLTGKTIERSILDVLNIRLKNDNNN